MPSLEVSGLKQDAVLWTAAGLDDEAVVTINAAVEIKIRTEKRRKESAAAQADPVATVQMVWVDREIAIKSIIWIGTLEAWNALSTKADLKQVIIYEEIPDIKGRDLERTVTLQKFGDSLPALA